MTAPEAVPDPTKNPATPRSSWREGFAVYLQRRVLIVLLLGFSDGVATFDASGALLMS